MLAGSWLKPSLLAHDGYCIVDQQVMRRGKNQDSDDAVQQGDASTMVNAQNTSAPDGGNSGNNAMQEHGAMDPDASMLSELGS